MNMPALAVFAVCANVQMLIVGLSLLDSSLCFVDVASALRIWLFISCCIIKYFSLPVVIECLFDYGLHSLMSIMVSRYALGVGEEELWSAYVNGSPGKFSIWWSLLPWVYNEKSCIRVGLFSRIIDSFFVSDIGWSNICWIYCSLWFAVKGFCGRSRWMILNAFKRVNVLVFTPFIVFRPSTWEGTTTILAVEKKISNLFVTGSSLITGMRFDALIRVVNVDQEVLSMRFAESEHALSKH